MPDASPVTALCCQSCGALDPGPRDVCGACGSLDLAPKDVPGEGKLVTWTTIRRAPTRFKGLAPYTVAVVDLAAGVRITGRLQGPADDLKPGAPIAAVGQENGAYLFAERRA